MMKIKKQARGSRKDVEEAHSSNIDFKEFMWVYRKCNTKNICF